MGRYERESLANEAQRRALISEIRMRLLDAFYADGVDVSSRGHLVRTIDSVLNLYR